MKGKVWPAKNSYEVDKIYQVKLKPLDIPEFKPLTRSSDKKSH
ncbi:hypothetical protein [Chitinophaga pinensis]|nr:hypothetical protein [Chitinophaga pinensis]